MALGHQTFLQEAEVVSIVNLSPNAKTMVSPKVASRRFLILAFWRILYIEAARYCPVWQKGCRPWGYSRTDLHGGWCRWMRRALPRSAGLFNGCRGLTGDLDLSKNDLDDSFVEQFLGIVEKSDGILDSVNLDENRSTTDGATKLVGGIQARARQSFGYQPLLLQLMNNAVDNCKEVKAVADAAGLRCRVGPAWTMEEAARAVKRKETWWLYFYGPIQLLRSKMLDIPSQPTMVECPICNWSKTLAVWATLSILWQIIWRHTFAVINTEKKTKEFWKIPNRCAIYW